MNDEMSLLKILLLGDEYEWEQTMQINCKFYTLDEMLYILKELSHIQ